MALFLTILVSSFLVFSAQIFFRAVRVVIELYQARIQEKAHLDF